MSSSAVDPIGHTRIDTVPDPYRAQHAARAQAQQFARIHSARQATVAATAAAATSAAWQSASPKADVPGASTDPLRDQYTAHCLKLAIQAFHDQQARLDAHAIAVNRALRDEQTALQARADAANDLGTIQGLLPQQPYRFVVGVPPMLPLPLSVAAHATPTIVAPVTHTEKLRSSTEGAASSPPPHPRQKAGAARDDESHWPDRQSATTARDQMPRAPHPRAA